VTATRIHKLQQLQRTRPVAETAAIAAVLVWFVVRRLSSSPSENLVLALLVAGGIGAVLITWAMAAVIAIFASVASSLDDLAHLVRVSVRASAPAMLFPAAIVLLSALIPVATLVGILLIAVTTAVFVSRTMPATPQWRVRRSSSGTPLSR
jgi:hypothetical protein